MFRGGIELTRCHQVDHLHNFPPECWAQYSDPSRKEEDQKSDITS